MEYELPVAGYYRISLARDNMHAAELYEDEIGRYCTYSKRTLARIYSDVDYSAFRGARERPSLNELIEDRKAYSAIIVPKLSRFGRSMKQLVKLFEIFDNDDIPLMFLDMNINTSTSQGRLLRHILAAFAEYESDVKADYSRANHRQRALRGGPPAGTPPVGYRRENKNFVVVAEEAEMVRDIFAFFLAGCNQTQIALQLNRSGRTRRSGLPWNLSKVAEVLANPLYPALRVVDGDFVQGTWDPLVPRELWDEAQALLAKRKEQRSDRALTTLRGRYLLSGLVFCPCGKKLYHHKVATRYAYECRDLGRVGCKSERITVKHADDFVTAALLERFPYAEMRDAKGKAVEERPMQDVWNTATTPVRREILALVVARIELVPRTRLVGVPYEERRLRIDWKNEWLEHDRVARIPVSVMPLVCSRRARCTRCGLELSMLKFDQTQGSTSHSGRCKRCREREKALNNAGYTVRETEVEQKNDSDRPRRLTWAEFRRERLLPR